MPIEVHHLLIHLQLQADTRILLYKDEPDRAWQQSPDTGNDCGVVEPKQAKLSTKETIKARACPCG